MIKSFLLIGFFLLAIFVTPWAWIGVLLLVLWKWRIWYRYNGRPWRKIHFNAMILASAASGKETATATMNNLRVDLRNVYVDMIRSFSQVGVHIGEDPEEFIDCQLAILGSPYDQECVINYLMKKKKINHSEAIKLSYRGFADQDLSENYFQIRAIIAGIIEKQYSSLDRGEYMYEVLMNNAP